MTTTLWELAAQYAPKEDQRWVASRLVTYACLKGYKAQKIDSEQIMIGFGGNVRSIDRLSVGSANVDIVAKAVCVDEDHFLNFLRVSEFDVRKTYNPRGKRRREYFNLPSGNE